jgi:hypothetical protein
MGNLKILLDLYALIRLFGGYQAVVLIPDPVLVLCVATLVSGLGVDNDAREGFMAVGHAL